jgi:hypothetical protein
MSSTGSTVGTAVGAAAAAATGNIAGSVLGLILEGLKFANSVGGQQMFSDILAAKGVDISGLIAAQETDPKPAEPPR